MFRRRIAAWFFRPPILAACALFVVGWIMAPHLARLSPEIAARDEYRLTPDHIRLSPPPESKRADLVQQSLRSAGLPNELSLLDDELLIQLQAALQQHPWIDTVSHIEKRLPARVNAIVTYRTPVAMVAVAGGLYPIDKSAVLLPPGDFEAQTAENMLLIKDVRSLPNGTAGTVWNDPAVIGAARLAALLVESNHAGIPWWKHYGIQSIHAPRRTATSQTPRELTFQLKTELGSKIIWGRTPGIEHPGELTPQQKLGRLELYVSRFGSFAEQTGNWEIDIRHWQEISRHPIADSTRISVTPDRHRR